MKNILKESKLRPHLNLLAFLFCLAGYSQSDTDALANLPSIVPPTPEVASLGKYIETPVNEFTGIPRIGIPIYDIKQGRINHSINLSYHAQGVKVEEIASRVGMGWTLNAGGMIHRQKRSSPDEMPLHGYLRTTKTVADFLSSNHDTSYFSLLYAEGNVHLHDFEPDLFTFSFGGYSGKFFFDQSTHEPIFEEATPLKVEWIDYAYFKITTPDGIQYYFGEDKDSTSSTKQIKGGDDVMDIYTTGKYGFWADETSPYVLNSPEYVATWYLKEIYDPIGNESITFDYEEYNLGKLNQRLSSSVLLEYRPSAVTSVEHSLSEQEVTEYVLTQIDFNNGRVDFIKDTNERLDLSGSHALKQINIYSNGNDVIKSFGLDNSIIQSNDGLSRSSGYDIFHSFNNLNDIQYRLFLLGLKEYAIDKENHTILYNDYKGHEFVYSNPEKLPHRFSNAQDFWGFHNGQNSNGTLLPKDYEYVGDKIHEFGNANRQIDQDHAQDGILTKISYPTGGTVEYVYENHRAKKDVSGDNFYDSRLNPLYYSYNYEIIRYSFNENNSHNNVAYFSGGTPYYVMEFSVDNPIKYENGNIIRTKVNINYENNHNYYFHHPDYYNNYCAQPSCVDTDEPYWEAYIQQKVNGSWPSSHMIPRVHNIQYEAGRFLGQSGLNEVYLEPQQEYRIVINWIDETSGSYNSNYHGPDDWSIALNYILEEEVELGENNAVLSGGLRVKEIKTNDLNGNIDTTTYFYEDENGSTTGNFVSLPYHVSGLGYYYYRDLHATICCPITTAYAGYENVLGIKYSAESSIPLATTRSSYTGYDKVTKIRGDGNIGKTEYFFSFTRDNLLMSTLYRNPIVSKAAAFGIAPVPLTNREIQRGKLLAKIDYNKDGDTIQNITNKYQLRTHKEIDAINPNLITQGGPRTELIQYVGNSTIHFGTLFYGDIAHVVNKYSLFSRTNLLQEQTSTIYDSKGENPITTSTNYYYDNDKHLQPTRIVTSNSKGETQITKTIYPDDIKTASTLTDNSSILGGNLTNTAFTAVQDMKGSANQITVPIQLETYKDLDKDGLAEANELLGLKRTNFKDWGSDEILPEYIQTSKGDNTLENRIIYHGYDKGNPIEISKQDGPPSYYVWGYNGQYPIARIKNFGSDQITTTVQNLINAAVTASNNDDSATDENTLRSALANLRNTSALQQAMVTTYTYDPLVGMTSETNPHGHTVYYVYDSFNRLKEIRDADNNLVTDYEYYYKN